MLYSKTCEYAIRALLYLASKPKGEYVLTRHVSRETGIPPAYLAKIVRDLAHHKILLSRCGAAGGVALAVEPKEISLQRIVLLMDDPAHLKACVMGLDRCSDQNACPLHEVWAAARYKMTRKMQKTTLDTVTKKVGKSRYREMTRGRLNSRLFLTSIGNNPSKKN